MTDSHDSTSAPSTHDLLALIDEQRAEIADLRARVDAMPSAGAGGEPTATRSTAIPSPTPLPPAGATASSPGENVPQRSGTDRRQMLRRVGVAAAGAALVAPLASRTAAAEDGDTMIVGEENQGESTTELFSGTVEPNKSVLGVADARKEIDIEAAVSGMATGARIANGIVGYTEAAYGNVETGHAIVSYPLNVAGRAAPRSNMWLRPQLPDPRGSGIEHTVGEIVSDDVGNLWHCVVAGTPGVWRRMSGAATAGAFVATEPSRVYDSRLTTGEQAGGRIFAGETRMIRVADVIALDGTVLVRDGVPVGATAVAYNLAVVNTINGGFLYLAPGDSTRISAASINWDEATSGALNNGSVVKVDGDRRLKVYCEGTGSTNFVIDIVGYYL